MSEYALAINTIISAVVGTLLYLWGYRDGRTDPKTSKKAKGIDDAQQ